MTTSFSFRVLARLHQALRAARHSYHPLALSLIVILYVTFPVSGWTQSQRFEDVERVVAFGDVHGANEALLELLRFLEIINADNAWIGGKTHLVSLGDLLDRGPDSRASMDLLMRLQDEAEAAGGQVHVVLGNHELMNLTGDMRYVSAGEYQAFAADETPQMREAAFAQMRAAGIEVDESQYPPGYFAHRQAFSADGQYGNWLLGLPTIVIVNDSAFVHAGFPDWLNHYSLQSINEQVSKDLRRLLDLGSQRVQEAQIPGWRDLLDPSLVDESDEELRWLQESPFLTNKGPFWYRGNALCHRQIEAGVVDRALANFSVQRLVMGHTPTSTRRIQQRFDGKVVLADTGMLANYYDGRPSALVMDSQGMRFAYSDEQKISDSARLPWSDARTQLDIEAWQSFLLELDYHVDDQGLAEPVSFQGIQLRPVFTRGNRRDNESRVAAFLLDQLLGLGMVPPTVERNIGGKSGTLGLLPVNTINESQRVAENLIRPNYCASVNDYQLMYIFDALIRNTSRSRETMLYNSSNLALVLTLSSRAFSTSSSFPEYLSAVPKSLPGPIAARLQAIDESTLQKALSSVLTNKQIRAIERRKQTLLETWRIEP